MKQIRPEEISSLIKEQIKNYGQKIHSDDVGYVISTGDGIAMVQGIDQAMSGELLELPHGKGSGNLDPHPSKTSVGTRFPGRSAPPPWPYCPLNGGFP